MADKQPQAIYLKDYEPSLYLVDKLHLEFDLDPSETQVSNTLSVAKNPASNKTGPLQLDGENITLKSVCLDGRTLSENEYELTETALIIPNVPDQCEVKTVVTLNPKANTTLSGLYVSKNNFCTQCESHGFRRITYTIDRPDVMSTFTTRINGDKKAYPHLLSNGNPVDKGDLEGNRHYVVWEDPFKKPPYLFALVAGDFHCHKDSFVTCSGRQIDLQIYVEKHNAGKTEHAMFALKESMDWDEKAYGREYDLDIYMIVAVSDFNMGAMENKGLNVFNDKYILADPLTATDHDYNGVLRVVAHEYFHNWSGNRVTLRDWFQLSLKEGFTVFREQSFMGDKTSHAMCRIEEMAYLTTAQFAEDSSPMSHPVRPASYIEMNNFYTVTVYEKGSELIRMLHTLLGPDLYRQATDLYFDKFDGQAVTTDDFVACMEEASKLDLSQFKRWYEQSGTPVLAASWSFENGGEVLLLTLKQHTPPTHDQKEKLPLHIPVRFALMDKREGRVGFSFEGKACDEVVLSLTESEQTFRFDGIKGDVIPSILRGFSAPVKLKAQYSPDELLYLAVHDDDPVSRYTAYQQLTRHEIFELLDKEVIETLPKRLETYLEALLNDDHSDPALLSAMLHLPSEKYLGEQMTPVPVDAIFKTRSALKQLIAKRFRKSLMQHYLAYIEDDYSISLASQAKRAFKNACLHYLASLHEGETLALAVDQYRKANNMTDKMGALMALNDVPCAERDLCLTDFYETFEDNALVMDKWLALQASSRCPDTLERVKMLSQHEVFTYHNPNKVYSLFAQFGANNPVHFHDKDGSGYRLIADTVIKLNTINPQVAARVINPLIHFDRYDEGRKSLMKEALTRIQGQKSLSKDLYEIVTKSLSN